MDDEIYSFSSEKDLDRVLAATRFAEAAMRTGRLAAAPTPGTAQPLLVKVTSATPNAKGLYEALFTFRQSEQDPGFRWYEIEEKCWAVAIDDSPLSVRRYGGVLTDYYLGEAVITIYGSGIGRYAAVALSDGPSVEMQFQTRLTGGWVDTADDPVDATIMDTNRNEPFVEGFRYEIFQMGPDNEWFCDTGEKTRCVDVPDISESVQLDCETGELIFTPLGIRVFDRECGEGY